jgi:hypothetical protein
MVGHCLLQIRLHDNYISTYHLFFKDFSQTVASYNSAGRFSSFFLVSFGFMYTVFRIPFILAGFF